MSPNKKTNPIFAEIVEANDERTVAALVLFDKRVRREFRGGTHLNDAQGWVNAWNEHFEEEWDCVRDTSALIMGMFTAGLKRRGVGTGTIRAALEELENVK